MSALPLLCLFSLFSVAQCGDCFTGIQIKNYTTSDCAGEPDNVMTIGNQTELEWLNGCHDWNILNITFSAQVTCDKAGMTFELYNGLGCNEGQTW